MCAADTMGICSICLSRALALPLHLILWITQGSRRIFGKERYPAIRTAKIAGIAAAVLLLIIYLIACLYKETGSFTISVNKHEMVKYGLSLCETRDLSKPASVLNMLIDEEITKTDEAIEDADTAFKICGSDAYAYNSLGIQYHNLKAYDKALRVGLL